MTIVEAVPPVHSKSSHRLVVGVPSRSKAEQVQLSRACHGPTSAQSG
jgi:hypothetical protein